VTTSSAKGEAPVAASRPAPKADRVSPRHGVAKAAKKVPVPPETPGIARIIAIANQKGGVGKSTTAVSLGASLADLGFRVLVIDLDPQGNASTGMGIRHEARATTVYHVIVAESPIDDAIVHTPVERLHAVPSTIDLAGAEIELVSQFSRESRLKKALKPIREGRYDFVLLDCPPSLGLLTINALTAAEELIVPIQCEYYALEGLGQLLKNVSLVQQNINPDLRLSGIVMTMFDPRTKLSEQVVAEVKRFFDELVYDVIIPRTVRLSEAPGFGQPISVYDPRSKGAQTYRQLAVEVASRPPPAEPMPVYDDLPIMVVPAVVDTVTPRPVSPVPEDELDERPTPTVRELADAEEAVLDVEAKEGTEVTKAPAARDGPLPPPSPPSHPTPPSPPSPPSHPSPEPTGPEALEKPAGGDVPEKAPARAKVEPAPSAPPARSAPVAPAARLDDDDVWEDSDSPTPANEPAPSVEPGRARRPPSGTPPEHLPARRVVVIDEDADLKAPSRPASTAGANDEPASPPAVASIGATLEEEEGHRKRRWRLFRKGGE
jgi:chromosome partitioning protein